MACLVHGRHGVAVHDAWAPYDTFTRSAPGPALTPASAAAPGEQPGGPVHQLCTAHVQRELQAVADTAGDGQWCWAAQACAALVKPQGMVADAIAGGRDPLDAAAVAQQTACLRSAARIGLSQTRARSAPLMRKHNADLTSYGFLSSFVQRTERYVRVGWSGRMRGGESIFLLDRKSCLMIEARSGT